MLLGAFSNQNVMLKNLKYLFTFSTIFPSLDFSTALHFNKNLFGNLTEAALVQGLIQVFRVSPKFPMERPPYYRDQEPLSLLEKRILSLSDHLETSKKPNLRKLDEYIAASAEYLQQEVQKGGKDYERVRERAQFLWRLQTGNSQDKAKFCLSQREASLQVAEKYEKIGEINKAARSRAAVPNWLKLAQACEQRGR